MQVGWFNIVGIALGIVGAVAFLLAYGDRQRLKGTIESYQTTVDAYKEELAITNAAHKEELRVTKEENSVLRGQVGECQGAIRVLTEAVTQSAKVEMLSHVSSDQHRAILLKLEEVRIQFAAVTPVITNTVLGLIRAERNKGEVDDGSSSSSNS